jgi:hypothetical protein
MSIKDCYFSDYIKIETGNTIMKSIIDSLNKLLNHYKCFKLSNDSLIKNYNELNSSTSESAEFNTVIFKKNYCNVNYIINDNPIITIENIIKSLLNNIECYKLNEYNNVSFKVQRIKKLNKKIETIIAEINESIKRLAFKDLIKNDFIKNNFIYTVQFNTSINTIEPTILLISKELSLIDSILSKIDGSDLFKFVELYRNIDENSLKQILEECQRVLKSTKLKSQEENRKLDIIEEKLKHYNNNIITKDMIKENLNEYRKSIVLLQQKINAFETKRVDDQQAAVQQAAVQQAAAQQAAAQKIFDTKKQQLIDDANLNQFYSFLRHADKGTISVTGEPNSYSLNDMPDLRATLNLVKTPDSCPANTWHWEFPGCYQGYIDTLQNNNYVFVEAYYKSRITGIKQNECILLININNTVHPFRVILGGTYTVGSGTETVGKIVEANNARVIYNNEADTFKDIPLNGINKGEILIRALDILYGDLVQKIGKMTISEQYNEYLGKLRTEFPNVFRNSKYNLQNKYLKNDSSLSKYESKYLKYKQKYLQLKKELS